MPTNQGLSPEELLRWAMEDYLHAPPDGTWGELKSISDLDPWLGMAFGLFGLPDGTRSSPGVSIRPGPRVLVNGLRNVVAPLLASSEKWLMTIATGLTRLPTTNAFHFQDKRSGAQVIILDAGIFAGLYSANDTFLELASALHSNASQQDLQKIGAVFASRIAWFLFGTDTAKDSWMFTFTSRVDPGVQGEVWAITTVQQVFLLLHELGHASDRTQSWEDEEVADGIVTRQMLGDTSAEDTADAWAATHMKGPMPRLIAEEPSYIVTGMFQLWEYLELCRKTGVYRVGPQYRMPRDRFSRIAQIVGPDVRDCLSPVLESYRDVFDQLAQFGLNQIE